MTTNEINRRGVGKAANTMTVIAHASNLSFEERLSFADVPQIIRDAIDEMLDKLAEEEKEIKRLERCEELVSEQASFARDLVENIDELVSSLPQRKTGIIPEFQKDYQRLRSDTYFEI